MRFDVPAYVLGGGINGLGVVRNLGRNGVPVHCIVERSDQVLYSKYCKKCYIIPNIETDPFILRNFFTNPQRQKVGGVIFSASDLFSFHLSKLKEALKNSYYIPLPSHEVIKTLVNKKEFYQSLSKYNIPHPVTYFPENPEAVNCISKEIKYPIFIKPVNSQEFSRKFHSKGFVAATRSELIKYYRLAVNSKTEVMLQEIIPGLAAKNVYGIESYFDKNSEPTVLFAHLRLRGWPPVFGNTCLRESISPLTINAQIELTKSYLQSLNFQGLMEAEWKMDPANGCFKLLEINPRQSMQNTLPSKCGVNFVLMAYLDSTNQAIKCPDNYKYGIKWSWFLLDLLSAIKTRTSLKEWLLSIKNIQEWAYLARDDFTPWVISSFKTISTLIRENPLL